MEKADNSKAFDVVLDAMEQEESHGLTVGEMGALITFSGVPIGEVTIQLFDTLRAAYNLGFARGQKTLKKG